MVEYMSSGLDSFIGGAGLSFCIRLAKASYSVTHTGLCERVLTLTKQTCWILAVGLQKQTRLGAN